MGSRYVNIGAVTYMANNVEVFDTIRFILIYLKSNFCLQNAYY